MTTTAGPGMPPARKHPLASRPEDTVFIFYAGHGAPEADPDSRDGDGIAKYLLPYEADPQNFYGTAIPMDEVARLFRRIAAERLVFISDACFSGASGGRTILSAGTRAGNAYRQDLVYERHRHRYEFNNQFRDGLEEAGMVYSGLSPDDHLVELCELANHPWMVSCQFHPEFRSRPGNPHPLFRDFIGAAKDILREGAQPLLPLDT